MVNDLLSNSKRLLERRQTGILSAAMIIMTAYSISGLLGLFRNRLLASRFFGGQEAQLDAYFAAFVLPDTIFQLLILGALSAAFIPVFTTYLKQSRKEAWQVAQSAMAFILRLFAVISALLFIFAPPASRLLAPQFSPPISALTANLIRIMLFAQLFFALSSFTTGVLQAYHRFLLPALAPIFYNLGIIGGIIFLSPPLGIYGPAIGVVVGSLGHLLVQYPLARRLGFRIRLAADFSHPGVKKMIRLMPARAATLAAGQLERIVAVVITSALQSGTLAIFNFARQLYVLPINLFGATIGQASFPTLADEHAADREKFTATLASSILQIAFFTIPAAAFLFILRIPMVRLAFGAKQFPWEATILTGKVVLILTLSIPAQSINQLLVRAFYAAHNTRLPLKTTMAATALLVVLAPILAWKLNLGVLGVALAIAAADITGMALLFLALERRLTPGLSRRIIPDIIKMAGAAVFMAVFLWALMRILDHLLDTSRTASLIFLTASVSLTGLTVYLAMSWALYIPQLHTAIAFFKRLGRLKTLWNESEEVLETAAPL